MNDVRANIQHIVDINTNIQLTQWSARDYLSDLFSDSRVDLFNPRLWLIKTPNFNMLLNLLSVVLSFKFSYVWTPTYFY